MAVEPAAALARSTLRAYLGLRPGEPLTVESWSSALPWAREFVIEARRHGSEVLLALEDEEGFFRSLESGAGVPTSASALARIGGAYVYFPGPEAFPRLLGLRPDDRDPALARHAVSWRAAARRSRLRGARMTVASVTSAAASRFGVDLPAWRDEVVRASLVPPGLLARRTRQLAVRLARARRLTIRHANGTGLRLEVRPGSFRKEDGTLSRPAGAVWTDIPAGRVAVGVRSGSVAGRWEANRPAYDRLGDTPVGVGARFSFEGGRLRELSFDRGGEAFAATFSARRQGAPTVVELSVGVNPEVGRAPEIGELASGALALRLSSAQRSGGRALPARSYLSVLHGADVNLDDRPWLAGGRPARRS